MTVCYAALREQDVTAAGLGLGHSGSHVVVVMVVMNVINGDKGVDVILVVLFFAFVLNR